MQQKKMHVLHTSVRHDGYSMHLYIIENITHIRLIPWFATNMLANYVFRKCTNPIYVHVIPSTSDIFIAFELI